MTAYDNITMCIVVGGVAKMYFYVNVDEFSLMQIVVPNGDNSTGAFDHPQMWFQAEYSGGHTQPPPSSLPATAFRQLPPLALGADSVLSFLFCCGVVAVSPTKYRSPQVATTNQFYGYIVPFWTLIITLDNGRVEKMEWDDGCLSCKDEQCVDSTCSVSIAETGCRAAGSKTDCSPKFFVGWFGTDRNGQYLTSAGSRYSRFRSYSLNSAFTSAYETASLEVL